eukprot:TRINITY_DN44_c0_g4_i1.p1 TRINITY_DN44_c0_g4~~TRINITY_DN44_c0_g4_i1.p1  ORF type:complete len:322 (-),score=45.63 TRINITY_DN44_c0_g4_i1:234-1112(-)
MSAISSQFIGQRLSPRTSLPRLSSGRQARKLETVCQQKIKVGINGFGRIGRLFFRCWYGREDSLLDVVAINDTGGVKQAKGGSIPTFVVGVNEEDYKHEYPIVSNASCTTNCLAPFVKVLEQKFGIVKGTMTTTHSYTGDQRLLDASHRDLRRARAANLNIVPTTTGAAKAVALVLPQLKGKLNGIALRVPTPTVSVVDLVVQVEKKTFAEEVNEAFKEYANGPMKGILAVEDTPLVSMDFKKTNVSSTVDSALTMCMGDDMVKVIAWYDNEWGYSQRVVDLAELCAAKWQA